ARLILGDGLPVAGGLQAATVGQRRRQAQGGAVEQPGAARVGALEPHTVDLVQVAAELDGVAGRDLVDQATAGGGAAVGVRGVQRAAVVHRQRAGRHHQVGDVAGALVLLPVTGIGRAARELALRVVVIHRPALVAAGDHAHTAVL